LTLLIALARACHPVPTLAVTVVMTALGWRLGWQGPELFFLFLAIITGQLSVGWSNDAHDADLDRHSQRGDKPVVSGGLNEARLWWFAIAALLVSAGLSWWVAGIVGGSFHVLSLVMAWWYNLRLSRTAWSWLPYVIAFAAVPPFLTFGLSGNAPPIWLVVVFGIVGVSAHLAQAYSDVDSDREAGVGGVVVWLGARRALLVTWTLLAIGSLIVMVVAWPLGLFIAPVFAIAVIAAARSRSRNAVFSAVLIVVLANLIVTMIAVNDQTFSI
jgi:4-hydroxybenzoate polyprenyltransferase